MSDEERPPEPPPPRPPELDPTIVYQAIFDGSRAAFVKLHLRYEGLVRYAVVRAATKAGGCDDVDGLVQDVWCRLLCHDRRILRYYDAERGPISSFLKWVAYQQAFELARRQRKRQPPSDELPLADLLGDDRALRHIARMVQSDFCQKLLAELDDQLTALDRALLDEHHLGDTTLRELAKQLGVSEDALYQRNRRLKQRLRRVAERLLEDPKPPPRTRASQAPPDVLVAILMIWFLSAKAEGVDPERQIDAAEPGNEDPRSLAT